MRRDDVAREDLWQPCRGAPQLPNAGQSIDGELT